MFELRLITGVRGDLGMDTSCPLLAQEMKKSPDKLQYFNHVLLEPEFKFQDHTAYLVY